MVEPKADPSKNVRLELAKRPKWLAEDVVKALMDDEDPQVSEVARTRSDTPVRRERKLTRRATTLANQRVTYKVPDTPGAAQAREALAAPDEGLAMVVDAHKAGGWDDPAAAMMLTQSPSTAVKMRVALTRGTPREVLEHLAQDSDPSVAKFAAKQLG